MNIANVYNQILFDCCAAVVAVVVVVIVAVEVMFVAVSKEVYQRSICLTASKRVTRQRDLVLWFNNARTQRETGWTYEPQGWSQKKETFVILNAIIKTSQKEMILNCNTQKK